MFSKKHKEEDPVKSEVEEAVDEASEQGKLESYEAEMIRNVLSFSDTDAREIMTHRNDIKAVDGSRTLDEALHEMITSSNSRFPVYEETIDTILGIITIRDAARAFFLHPEMRDSPISEIPGLLREATIFPESRSIDKLMQSMRAQKIQLIIVVDEYGQTSGVVSMEDIVEEIVGNILDEYDPDENFIQHGYDDSIVMDGMTPLERAEEVLQTDFQTEDFETLNGYLTDCLGHVPTANDKMVTGNGFLFHILKVENHTIRKVRAERQRPVSDKKETT